MEEVAGEKFPRSCAGNECDFPHLSLIVQGPDLAGFPVSAAPEGGLGLVVGVFLDLVSAASSVSVAFLPGSGFHSFVGCGLRRRSASGFGFPTSCR